MEGPEALSGKEDYYTRDFTWNEDWRLKTVKTGKDVVNFLYDAGGERTSKLGVNGESLYFNSWFSATEDGADYRYLKHVFVGSERLVTRVRQERGYSWDSEDLTTYYYHPDHLGSVSVVSNHRGKPYERVEYLPFGEVWIEEVDSAAGYIPFRFTSKELDRETGLYYYGARYYEPKFSRWMSADPAGFALSNPNRGGYSVIEALNWYSYVSNNPVNYVDPAGMREVADATIPRDRPHWKPAPSEHDDGTNSSYSYEHDDSDSDDNGGGGSSSTSSLAGILQSHTRLIPNGYKDITWKYRKYKRSGLGFRVLSNGEDTIVAFQGLNPLSITDWDAARRQAIKGDTSEQFDDALTFVRGLLRGGISPSNLTLTGSSLGGALAAYVGSKMGIETVTFNAAGVHPDNVGPYPDSVTNYYMQGDYLTNIQGKHDSLPTAIGTQIMVSPAPGDEWRGGFLRHFIGPMHRGLEHRGM